jgi:hypothetical protein
MQQLLLLLLLLKPLLLVDQGIDVHLLQQSCF